MLSCAVFLSKTFISINIHNAYCRHFVMKISATNSQNFFENGRNFLQKRNASMRVSLWIQNICIISNDLARTAPSTLNSNENVIPKAHHPHWQFNFFSADFKEVCCHIYRISLHWGSSSGSYPRHTFWLLCSHLILNSFKLPQLPKESSLNSSLEVSPA